VTLTEEGRRLQGVSHTNQNEENSCLTKTKTLGEGVDLAAAGQCGRLYGEPTELPKGCIRWLENA
jgi:hypothetical protein